MATGSCYTCEYLSKRPGVKNYFIYKCAHWGLVTQNVLPQSAVISSIGHKCPFYKQKSKLNKKPKSKDKKNMGDDGFDLLI